MERDGMRQYVPARTHMARSYLHLVTRPVWKLGTYLSSPEAAVMGNTYSTNMAIRRDKAIHLMEHRYS